MFCFVAGDVADILVAIVQSELSHLNFHPLEVKWLKITHSSLIWDQAYLNTHYIHISEFVVTVRACLKKSLSSFLRFYDQRQRCQLAFALWKRQQCIGVGMIEMVDNLCGILTLTAWW